MKTQAVRLSAPEHERLRRTLESLERNAEMITTGNLSHQRATLVFWVEQAAQVLERAAKRARSAARRRRAR